MDLGDVKIGGGMSMNHPAPPEKVIVLDDDPTGTQTVHDVDVSIDHDLDVLTEHFDSSEKVLFILTNSRSLTEKRAVSLTEDIIRNICLASRKTSHSFSIISRSDSTLRGHFPAENRAAMGVMQEELGIKFRGEVLLPAFFEGGRITKNDVHWVEDKGKCIEVGKTPFAQDPLFKYKNSNLREWIKEKTNNGMKDENIVGISLNTVRQLGVTGVLSELENAPERSIIFCNAANYDDLKVIAGAFLRAEEKGFRYFYRSAASFVPVYCGISLRPPLTSDELNCLTGKDEIKPAGGLVVVGSHVPKTTEQLKVLLSEAEIEGLELNISRLLSANERSKEIIGISKVIDNNISLGRDTVLFTSRKVYSNTGGFDYREVGEIISASLVDILDRTTVQPRFIVGKGGITSSDLLTRVYRSKKSRVVGQIIPGVPLWRLGSSSKAPGKLFTIFPGNVGGERALLETVQLLKGQPVK